MPAFAQRRPAGRKRRHHKNVDEVERRSTIESFDENCMKLGGVVWLQFALARGKDRSTAEMLQCWTLLALLKSTSSRYCGIFVVGRLSSSDGTKPQPTETPKLSTTLSQQLTTICVIGYVPSTSRPGNDASVLCLCVY